MNTEGMVLQSILGPTITAFVAEKRALSRRYDTEERALRLFDHYLASAGVTGLADIHPEIIDAFLASRPRSRPRSYNHLLGVLSRLFGWMVEQEILTESPVRAKPRRVTSRRLPFLFTAAQAQRLLDTAARLPDRPRGPMRGPTYELMFALLYGLGLRVGELSRLCGSDVDLERGVLVIRNTKFQKSRMVPFGPRIAARLEAYRCMRDQRYGPRSPALPFFSFGRDRAVHPGTISQTFHHLVPALGLIVPPGVASPRLHDLRHSFAVGRLLRWYREGINPSERLYYLSTFMGHVNPASTAEYLTITAELLDEANRRFEEFARPVSAALVLGDTT